MMAYLIQLYWGFRSEILAIPWRVISLVFLIFLAIFPLITSNPYVLKVIVLGFIFAIYAASWDLLAGFTGQFSAGHAVFFGVGAYAAGLLNVKLGLAPWITIPAGALMATIAGLIVCLPALRLRGLYLTLITFAFPIIISGVIETFPNFTGGELGISGLDGLLPTAVGNYYLIFLVMIVLLLVMWKPTDSRSQIVRTGLIFQAIREDEIAARSAGIKTTQYKMLAFALSGLFAGIAGGLYAHFMRVIGPSLVTLFFSFNPILWSVFGGMGTIYGPVAGVFILYPLTEFMRLSRLLVDMRFVIQALILILVIIFMPQGITTWIRDHIEVVCPRCKLVNINTRRFCRACDASLHRER